MNDVTLLFDIYFVHLHWTWKEISLNTHVKLRTYRISKITGLRYVNTQTYIMSIHLYVEWRTSIWLAWDKRQNLTFCVELCLFTENNFKFTTARHLWLFSYSLVMQVLPNPPLGCFLFHWQKLIQLHLISPEGNVKTWHNIYSLF